MLDSGGCDVPRLEWLLRFFSQHLWSALNGSIALYHSIAVSLLMPRGEWGQMQDAQPQQILGNKDKCHRPNPFLFALRLVPALPVQQ